MIGDDEMKARIKRAAQELRNCMNEYGRLGFSVDIDISHLSLYEIAGKTIINHEVHLDITDGFRV